MTFETSGDQLTQEKLDTACPQTKGSVFLITRFDKVKTTKLEHTKR